MTGGEPKITLINPPKYWAELLPDIAGQINLSVEIYSSSIDSKPENLGNKENSTNLENIDLALFFFSAENGLSQNNIDLFNKLRELYIPVIVLVVEIEITNGHPVINTEKFFSETLDYEDYLPILEKTLEPMPTKYLPLYSEGGAPIAFINLEISEISDYSNLDFGKVKDMSSQSAKKYPATPEHLELVENFTSEYQERIEEFGADGFRNGLFSIAHPLYGKELSNLGVWELIEILISFKNSY